jgi:hypothetical protein
LGVRRRKQLQAGTQSGEYRARADGGFIEEEAMKYLLFFVGALTLLAGCGDLGRPDPAAIRHHMVTRLSDAEIRKFRTDAEVEAARRYDAIKRDQEEQAAKELSQRKMCLDVAYRTRNEAKCVGSGFDSLFPQTIFVAVEPIFEAKLVGACAGAQTIRQARELNCLPK